jgi:acetyltransferase-like isoleucine patch superfamily enzyme
MSVHPSAIVSAKARLGADVSIGPFTVVHDNVVVGDRGVIGSHCEIGHPTALADGRPLVFGADALIRSHSVFYEGSEFGPGLRTGHRVTVRDGFIAGIGLQIGTLCDFQGETRVGDYVRTHSSVHLGRLTEIGNFVWIYPYTVLTNDPHPPSDGLFRGVIVEDYAVVATTVTVMPGVRIGARSLVGAHSLVTRDVPPDTVVAGVPAKPMAATRDIKLKDGSGLSAYPWMRHFHRGYPDEVVAGWLRDFGSLEATPAGDPEGPGG